MQFFQLITLCLFFFSSSHCSGNKSSGKKKNSKKSSGKREEYSSNDQTINAKKTTAAEEYSVNRTEYFANGSIRVKSIKPEKESKKEKKKSKLNRSDSDDSQMKTYFSGVDKVSDPSSAPDERLLHKAFLTEQDIRKSDLSSLNRKKAISQLPRKVKIDTKQPLPHYIAGEVDSAVMQTDFDGSYDGGMCVGNTNYDAVTGKVPPPYTGDREPNFEVDPFARDYFDPDTSQNKLRSHIGRPIARDGKEKNFERRNSYSSINDEAPCAMNDPAQIAQFLNDKYANVCSDKCKLLNALETVGRECRNTQREISYLFDLIGECLDHSELLQISGSDDEFDSEVFLDASVDADIIANVAQDCKIFKHKKKRTTKIILK